jgi:hypothetical protein
MDDKFGYLFLGLSFLIFWILFFVLRQDLRRKQIKVSLKGGFMGPIAEYLNYKDYWHPPSLMGNELIFVEDFIIGFSITGVSVVVFDIFFKTTDGTYVQNERKTFGIMFFLGLISLFYFSGLGFNSVFVSSIMLPILTLFIFIKRPDLIKLACWTSFIVVCIMLVVYHILYNILFEKFWDKYWLLANTKYGVTILGNIPITEIIWFFTWGSFAGVAHNFSSGQKKVPLSSIK